MNARKHLTQFAKVAVGFAPLAPGAKSSPPFGPTNYGLNNFPTSQMGQDQPNPLTPQTPAATPATPQGIQQTAQLGQANNVLAQPPQIPGATPPQPPGANLEQAKVLQASVNPELITKIAKVNAKYRLERQIKAAKMSLTVLGTLPEATESVPEIEEVTKGTDPVGGAAVKAKAEV